MIREIVSIDDSLCDGCGECVPSCEEGAIRIIEGKARLVSDQLCDGLGACLGVCPQGAITIERRQAMAFDEAAVARAQAPCPSARPVSLQRPDVEGPGEDPDPASPCPVSELTHWPVKLRLLPPTAPILRGARLLLSADCVSVACGSFHSELLRDRAVVIACPKLDDTRGYVEKLAEIIDRNDLTGITVAHMEVPCCTGIVRQLLEARRLAGSDVPVEEVTVSIRGEIITRRELPVEPMVTANHETAERQATGVE
jgi:NAD-dependent dihydropyrimidine dehydrogenase PreA subunit